VAGGAFVSVLPLDGVVSSHEFEEESKVNVAGAGETHKHLIIHASSL
jgi:hypothetical protein